MSEALVEAVDALLDLDPVRLADTAVTQTLSAAMAATDRLQALTAGLTAELADRGLTDDGYTSAPHPTVLLRDTATTRIGATTARAIVARSRARARLPLLAAQHDTGTISTAVFDAAATGTRRLPPETWPSIDAVLTDAAHALDPVDVTRLIAQITVMIDNSDANDHGDHADTHSRVYLSRVGANGSWDLRGTLHGTEAERLASVLEALRRQTRDNPTGAPAQPGQPGQPAPGAATRLSPAEQHAQALYQLARLVETTNGATPPHGTDSHVVVIAHPDTATGAPGSPAATTAGGTLVDPGALAAMTCHQGPDTLTATPAGDTPGPGTPADGPPNLQTPSPNDDATLLQRALAGLIRPPAGQRLQPLNLARTARVANTAQYLALIARDGGCVDPHCHRPPAWTVIHHLLEWHADHGPTDLTNLALLCWPHHTQLHRRGHHLHPPWCHCGHCRSDRWDTHHHPPVLELQRQLIPSDPRER